MVELGFQEKVSAVLDRETAMKPSPAAVVQSSQDEKVNPRVELRLVGSAGWITRDWRPNVPCLKLNLK